MDIPKDLAVDRRTDEERHHTLGDRADGVQRIQAAWLVVAFPDQAAVPDHDDTDQSGNTATLGERGGQRSAVDPLLRRRRRYPLGTQITRMYRHAFGASGATASLHPTASATIAAYTPMADAIGNGPGILVRQGMPNCCRRHRGVKPDICNGRARYVRGCRQSSPRLLDVRSDSFAEAMTRGPTPKSS